MKQIYFFLGIFALVANGLTAPITNRGDEVVVVYNTRVLGSKAVAEHYAEMRRVPEAQVLGFDLPDGESMSRVEFREQLQKPLAAALAKRKLWRFDVQIIPTFDTNARRLERKVVETKVRYVALCYGVPLIIKEDPDMIEDGEEKLPPAVRRNEAAVDSELACLPYLDQNMLLAGPRANPLFGCTNAEFLSPTNGILLVARLDGPTATIARNLVDKAMEAETNGLWGRAYFDLRGLTNGDPARVGDDWLAGAAEVCKHLGLDTVVDTNYATFPATFPLSQIAFYAGWHDDDADGPFARPTVEFMPGAFAYHLHSFSAKTIRSTKRQWVGPLLEKGATATMGCVDEPFLGGTPNVAVFFARFTFSGFTFGEAAYASQNYVSWMTTVAGDPLYRPFGRNAEELTEDLKRRHNKVVEWSYLRTLNIKLVMGTPLEEIIFALENFPSAQDSAVLQEKLADLYAEQGKPSSCVHTLQKVLQLGPTPQQRVRVMLELAGRLIALGREPEAYGVDQEFVAQCADYPGMLGIYHSLQDLARKLGKNADAARYQHEIEKIISPQPQTEKRPTPKTGY